METTILHAHNREPNSWETGRWVFPFILYLLFSSMVVTLLGHLIEGHFSYPPSTLVRWLGGLGALISFAASFGRDWWRSARNRLFDRLFASRIEELAKQAYPEKSDLSSGKLYIREDPAGISEGGWETWLRVSDIHFAVSRAMLEGAPFAFLEARRRRAQMIHVIHDLAKYRWDLFQSYHHGSLWSQPLPYQRHPYGPIELLPSSRLLVEFAEEIARLREEINYLHEELVRQPGTERH
jgi:hypothetical protein